MRVNRLIAACLALLGLVAGAHAIPLTTQVPSTLATTQCAAGQPIVGGGAGLPIACGSAPLTNSLGGAVTMTTQNTYYDGPVVAQGAIGTWFASGTATIIHNSGDQVLCKLWDGTTVLDSGVMILPVGGLLSMHLSGYLASPAGNLRISCTNATGNGGLITVGNGVDLKASTISAFRIN